MICIPTANRKAKDRLAESENKSTRAYIRKEWSRFSG